MKEKQSKPTRLLTLLNSKNGVPVLGQMKYSQISLRDYNVFCNRNGTSQTSTIIFNVATFAQMRMCSIKPQPGLNCFMMFHIPYFQKKYFVTTILVDLKSIHY